MNETDQLVSAVSRDLVSALAPSEVPMFRANSSAYFTDPDKALKPRDPGAEMLGFGLGEAAMYLTPVILAAVKAVVDFAISEFGKAARAQGEAAISAWVKGLFKRLQPAAAAPAAQAPLSREPLQRLRQVAFNKARNFVDEAQANRLADEVIGQLATS